MPGISPILGGPVCLVPKQPAHRNSAAVSSEGIRAASLASLRALFDGISATRFSPFSKLSSSPCATTRPSAVVRELR